LKSSGVGREFRLSHIARLGGLAEFTLAPDSRSDVLDAANTD
jgi:hypothetical protein